MSEQEHAPEIKLGVYQAIQNTMSDLSKVGIAKEQKNVAQGFKFRGIDDVYQATSRILSKNNLVIIPRDLQRQVTERPTRNGGVQLHVVLEVEYTFVCPTDGSFHKTVATGEALDSGDKAISKARTCAYKYLLFQTFCIPVQGEDDADAHSHEIVELPKQEQPKTLDAEASQDAFDVLIETLAMAKSINDIDKWRNDNIETITRLTTDHKNDLRDALKKAKALFQQKEAA